MEFTGPSLRDRLRVGTRLSQDALERAQKRFDLTRTEGYAGFLGAQRDTLRAMQAAGGELADAIEAALGDLDADLAEVGPALPSRKVAPPRVDDPRGRGYVWHSQQLHLRMLARRIPEGAQTATRYLSRGRDSAAWRALCDDLEAVPGYGAEAERALIAANDWLALGETIHLGYAKQPS
ncbi:heme oxygenase-like domain-containing protein [Jannaschia marina]|uniref:hypothetical protein n=1 Tax=Jannaschia marina TaxID=2741674 RepID=UPI0015CCAB74|nr:hypothetical protein [Jannaschia marina]